MLDDATVSELTAAAVRRRLPDGGLQRVSSRPIADSDGKDALRIELIFDDAKLAQLTGDDAIDLLVDIQDSLQKRGDERFPIVEYATEQDLMDDEREARTLIEGN